MEDIKKLSTGEYFIPVPNDVMLELERTFYEKDGLLAIVSQYGSDSPFKPDIERFKLLVGEYIVAHTIFSMTFNMVVNTYAPKEWLSKSFTANFNLSGLTCY